jgi:hypothetical protein
MDINKLIQNISYRKQKSQNSQLNIEREDQNQGTDITRLPD